MTLLESFLSLQPNKTSEILETGGFSDLISHFAKVLQNELPSLRPRNSLNKPGAFFRFNPSVEKVLYFGDIHPSKRNINNFVTAIAPHFRLLTEGRLGIIVGGDFTHPADGDLTDMEPSVVLLQQVLIPLKILFPNNIVLLRGDHESVGSPYGEDFGKGTNFLPLWTLERGLYDLVHSGLVWAMGPNKPEFRSKAKFTGIYHNAPNAERYSLGGKKFGKDSFKGSWHTFHRIEKKGDHEYLVFRGAENRPEARWVRVDYKDEKVSFILEDGEREILCSLAVNQSRAYGLYIERLGGHKTLETLQYHVYDQLPLVVAGASFVGVHGAPIEKLSPHDDTVQISPLSREQLIEMSNPFFRKRRYDAYRRLIFGRPIEGNSFSFTPKIVENFLKELGNDPKDLFIMGHTRPDHFLEGYRRIYPKRGEELLLNDDVYQIFGPGWNHIVVDSQSDNCSHLLIDNRRPNTTKGEEIGHLFKLMTI